MKKSESFWQKKSGKIESKIQIIIFIRKKITKKWKYKKFDSSMNDVIADKKKIIWDFIKVGILNGKIDVL